MKTLTQYEFLEILQQARIKPKLKSELKFIKSTQAITDWGLYEIIAITDKTGDRGVLLLQPYTTIHIAPYEISRRIVDSLTGRARAVICDFCFTWQSGTNAASITFAHSTSGTKIRFLCCADLLCSQHVREMTKASTLSKSQLRENITKENKILRLKEKVQEKIDLLELPAVKLEH